MDINKLLFITYIGTTAASIVIHIFIGFCLKAKFKKANLIKELNQYYKMYKKENRSIKYFTRYLVYLIPILNILVAIIEIFNFNKVFTDIFADVKKVVMV